MTEKFQDGDLVETKERWYSTLGIRIPKGTRSIFRHYGKKRHDYSYLDSVNIDGKDIVIFKTSILTKVLS